MDHDPDEFFQEFFRDFSVMEEHFPMVPGRGKSLRDEVSSVSLLILYQLSNACSTAGGYEWRRPME